MAWDARAAPTSRRRQNSSASRASSLSISSTSTLTLQQRAAAASGVPVEPKSAHVADPFLRDFLQPGFDSATYWNTTLGRSKTTAGASSSSFSSLGAAGRLAAAATSATSTADRAAQAQVVLSQLGAHTSRLTGVLTQLTDDILRSGSRLAYEVELLRGEAIGLGEVVVQHQAALQQQQQEQEAQCEAQGEASEADDADKQRKSAEAAAAVDGVSGKDKDADAAADAPPPSTEPPALAQLRMLAQVRSRLDAVIHTFGDAMEFVMPPSTMSVTASFLSVSGPDQSGGGSGSGSGSGGASTSGGTVGRKSQDGADTGGGSMEDRGQQVLRERREEIAKLLESATTANNYADLAAARVAALRSLCRVWTGTAEEKARTRFVDSLQRMVEDRQRDLDRERERLGRQEREKREREVAGLSGGGGSSSGDGQRGSGASSPSPAASGTEAASSGQGTHDSASAGVASRGYAAAGYGFISQLQKIRSGL